MFRLTPSRSAWATSRACRLLGIRTRNCPLDRAGGLGFGVGSPCFLQLSRYERTASRPFTTACSGVPPSEWHPGRSGYSIKYPPPSSADSGRMVNGYLSMLANSLMVGILQLADEFHEVTHVPGLDRDVLRHGCSARLRVSERHVACASLAVDVD